MSLPKAESTQAGLVDCADVILVYIAGERINRGVAAAVKDAAPETIVPGWAKCAGPDATAVFNQYIAPHAGFTIA